MKHTLQEANALLHRMAWQNPHRKYCAMCAGENGVHRTTRVLSGKPLPLCPLTPIRETPDVDGMLFDRVRAAQWCGAGSCLACDAMLPWSAPGASFNTLPFHRPGCEVARVLSVRQETSS